MNPFVSDPLKRQQFHQVTGGQQSMPLGPHTSNSLQDSPSQALPTAGSTSTGYCPSAPWGMANGGTSAPLASVEGGASQYMGVQWMPVYWFTYQ